MSSYGIKNVAVAIELILKLVNQNITQLQEGYKNIESSKNYVSISTIIGRRQIPAKCAKILAKAVRKIQGVENLKDMELWRALEILAERYLENEN